MELNQIAAPPFARCSGAASIHRRRITPRREGFASEADLVSAVKAQFSVSLGCAWAWLQELESPSGIADLVAVKLLPDPIENLATVAPRWAYALKCLPYQDAFTAGWFAETAGVTERYARELLSAFARGGYCECDNRGKTWIKVREPRPIGEKIVAIEAKLRDWRRALYQASQYQDYASQSWVVLDYRWIGSAQDNAERFAAKGIGLSGLRADGELEIVVSAENRPPRMMTRFWHVNAEIARRMGYSPLTERPFETV